MPGLYEHTHRLFLIVHLFLLDQIVLENFHPVSNLCFLEKVDEMLEGFQFQRILEETDYMAQM